jgi:hypothetical protein
MASYSILSLSVVVALNLRFVHKLHRLPWHKVTCLELQLILFLKLINFSIFPQSLVILQHGGIQRVDKLANSSALQNQK